MRLFENANFQFVKYRYYAYALSILFILAGVFGLITKGLNWSIEFSSGVSARVNLQSLDKQVPPVEIDKLRGVLAKNGFKEAEIQFVGKQEEATFLIKIRSLDKNPDSANNTKDSLIKILQTEFPDYIKGRDMNTEVIQELSIVGPKVGGELRTQALLACLIAMLLIIIYVWFRYELVFGVMAIVALLHDVFIIVGIFSLMGKEITVQIIAVLLTIIGYSINDTIVIFDRIREDLKKSRTNDYTEIFNRAINETLSRTVITFLTTFFTTGALFFFGGPVIHDFAFGMLLGLFFGTFSTIFVASNLVIEFFLVSHKEKDSLKKLTKKK